ncbi:MAG: ATP synthase F0 subunit B [Deltaproteobacteria bacterium]|nr:ATP synthase F0 subunit B [Deltaproteobacteria bacterium]
MLNWWGFGSAYQDNPAIGWMIITFVIFMALLLKAIKKPLANYLEARSEQIKNAIEEAKFAKEEAELKLRQYENRLLELDAELAKIKEDFRRQGEAEKARLKEEAKQIADQMLANTEETLKAEVSKAKHELKQEVAEHTLKAAQKRLGVSESLEAQLCQNFVENTTEARV